MDINGKKIMITTGGGIGDSIMFTPALRRIKELYPSAHLTFLTRYPNHRLLEGLPYIDKLIYIQRGTAFSRLRIVPHLAGQDALVMTDWQPQTLLFAKLLGVPLRAGYPRDGHPFSKYLTKHIKPSVFASTDFAAETNAKVFSDALDIRIDGDMTRTDVSAPTADELSSVEKKLEAISAEGEYIVMCPFTSELAKDFPPAEAMRCAALLEERYHAPVVWIGSPERAGEIRSPHNLMGKTTVGESIAVLKKARFLVSADTGPVHISAALGTPTVVLFGAMTTSIWAPKRHARIVACDGNTSFIRPDTVEEYERQGLLRMAAIRSEQVLEAVETLLREESQRE
ncbi:lipopolysaccharide heptosyltransferase I [Selenomonas sp. TAMA-11512]|uniref:glycosyltransferase family 9 protein n=1 Tax=Selenomonas sp. TAMA-11512 TaxID=3095337 RepID=UPI003086923F|nr:lipopolysaccharide heptosyltransferase I [Selenomonas sp. TAMA-11512]